MRIIRGSSFIMARTFPRSSLPRVALFSFLVCMSLLAEDLPINPAFAQTTFTTNVQGTVTEAHTGRPIASAQVTIANLNLSTVTNAQGQFSWNAISIPQAVFTTTIPIAASGFGNWTLQNVRLLANDTLLLTPLLGASPTTTSAP